MYFFGFLLTFESVASESLTNCSYGELEIEVENVCITVSVVCSVLFINLNLSVI